MVAWWRCGYQRSGISDQDARSRRAPQNVAATNAERNADLNFAGGKKKRRKAVPTERIGHGLKSVLPGTITGIIRGALTWVQIPADTFHLR